MSIFKSVDAKKCVALYLFSMTAAHADELRWTHYGVRPLGMGNAFVAVADDHNALFYNPAGLARLSSWSFEILNPSIGISTNTLSAINSISELASGSSAEGGKSEVETAIETFDSLEGKHQYMNLGWTPHVVFPGFGIGIGLDIGARMTVHHQLVADIDAGLDVLVPISFARNMLEDRLSLGATLKGVAKTGVDHEFSLADISAFTKKDATETSSDKALKDYLISGKGVGVDFGLLFTPVKTMSPTLGVSITDAGGTPFKASSDQYGTPDPRQPSVNTGISFKPVERDNMYVLVAADVHAANQPIHFSKKFNLGSELGLGKILKLQGGLHQGELSGGFQLDAWLIILRFATYAEQVGSTAGEHALHADRRYVMQLKMLL